MPYGYWLGIRGKCETGYFENHTAGHGNSRVNWLVTEHLSTQGRPDPKGGLHCSWCSNKTSTPPIGPLGALKIVKNGLELRKLWPPK
jgi:hypothetical protein